MDEKKEQQPSIVVPIDDELDTVKSDDSNKVDELAMELEKKKKYSKIRKEDCYYRQPQSSHNASTND